MNTKRIISLGALMLAIGAVWIMPKQAELVLPIPFSTQAPTGNWDGNKDCEETSITMAYEYLNGNEASDLSVQRVLESVSKLNEWEKTNLGYHLDTGAEDTGKMASEVYGLGSKIIHNFETEDLKRELKAMNVILLPINAGLLPNARYQNKPPFYHMVVVRGFTTDNKFVVNDPGTESGKGNIYTFEELKNAAADWNHQSQSMDSETKVALVLSKS